MSFSCDHPASVITNCLQIHVDRANPQETNGFVETPLATRRFARSLRLPVSRQSDRCCSRKVPPQGPIRPIARSRSWQRSSIEHEHTRRTRSQVQIAFLQ